MGKEDQLRGLILAALILSLGGQAQAALAVQQVEGRISRVGVGTHTAYLDVVRADGSAVTIQAGASMEGLSESERHELDRLQAELTRTTPTGSSFPSVTDTHNRVRIWYLVGGNVGKRPVMLRMQTLQEQVPLWGVVIASLSPEAGSSALDLQLQAEQRGFPAGRFSSNDFPRLRPGYEVVVAGVFPTQAQAESCRRKARKSGYADAYLRRIR